MGTQKESDVTMLSKPQCVHSLTFAEQVAQRFLERERVCVE